jgi:uncharacterized protein YcbK (DUF882 family)
LSATPRPPPSPCREAPPGSDQRSARGQALRKRWGARVLGASCALFLLLAACTTRPPEILEPALPPLPDNRRIVLVHPPSKERLDVIYWRGGRYDPAAMESIARLARDRSSGQVHAIDPQVIDFLFDLLSRSGLPSSTEIHVLSGFRSRATNAALVRSGEQAARQSLHMEGKALDVRIPLLPGGAIGEIAKTMQRGGAAFYPADGHTHVDTGAVRTWRTR